MICEGEDADCGHCGGEGFERIAGCPRRHVDAETWAAVALAEDAEHGLLPVSGGVLDQTQSFNDARRFVRAEQARMKAERDPMGLAGRK